MIAEGARPGTNSLLAGTLRFRAPHPKERRRLTGVSLLGRPPA